MNEGLKRGLSRVVFRAGVSLAILTLPGCAPTETPCSSAAKIEGSSPLKERAIEGGIYRVYKAQESPDFVIKWGIEPGVVPRTAISVAIDLPPTSLTNLVLMRSDSKFKVLAKILDRDKNQFTDDWEAIEANTDLYSCNQLTLGISGGVTREATLNGAPLSVLR